MNSFNCRDSGCFCRCNLLGGRRLVNCRAGVSSCLAGRGEQFLLYRRAQLSRVNFGLLRCKCLVNLADGLVTTLVNRWYLDGLDCLNPSLRGLLDILVSSCLVDRCRCLVGKLAGFVQQVLFFASG